MPRSASLVLICLLFGGAVVQAAPGATSKHHPRRCYKVKGTGKHRHKVRVKCRKKRRPRPKPTPTPTATPTQSATPTPTQSATPTPTQDPTPTATPTVTGIHVTAPNSATAGQPFPVTAVTHDASDATLGDVTAGTTFTITPDGSCTGSSCTITAAGPHTVHGTYNGFNDIQTTNVEAAPLDHLVVSPSSATVCPAPPTGVNANYNCPTQTTQAFTAEGRDAYNNSLGDETAMAQFGATSTGLCQLNVCHTGTDTAPETITANVNGKTGTATLTGSDPLSMTCQGSNYDLDGATPNGCEAAQTAIGGSQNTAIDLGTNDCNDTPPIGGVATTALLADARTHTNPAVANFDATTGAAPIFYLLHASGGAFCQNDLSITLKTTGGIATACYQLKAITDKGTYTSTVISGSGTSTVTQGSGSYTDGSDIYFEVVKTCTVKPASTNFTISGHI